MNWVKENKFLTGYIAVMAIGVGALGFKVLSASGALDEANERYTAKASEYNRLRHLAPSANRKNLEAFQAQKEEAAQAISAFQTELTQKEIPVEQITPEQFQDRLKIAVTAVQTKAKEANVVLEKNEKFYLGFDRYETQPPDKDAAAALGRQLKAIEWVVQQALASGITELRKLDRPELPEEKGKGAVAGRPASGPPKGNLGGPGNRPDRGTRGGRQDLVTSQPFDLVVFCRQQQAANLLNTIVSPKAPQFFIPRNVRITNQNPAGPQRVVDAPPAAADPNNPAPPPAAPAANVSYIVGEEKVDLALRLEIVDFAEPSKPEAGKK
jgi:hypothetical protein